MSFRERNEQDPTIEREDIAEVIRKNSPFLRQFIAKRAPNKQDVDDIMQTTLLEAIKAYHKFRGDSQVRTWLCGIAYNIIRNSLKKRERDSVVTYDESLIDSEQATSFANPLIAAPEDPASQAERETLLQKVQESYDGMTSRMQDVVHSLIVEGDSYQDTAKKVDVPLGTVRSRMANARKIFRENLSS